MPTLPTIYIVTVEKLDQMLQSRMWYSDHYEAMTIYERIIDRYLDDRIVTVYSVEVEDTINELVDDLMKNRHSSVSKTPLEELRSNRKAAEPELEWDGPRVNGTDLIYMEVAYGGDYWGYDILKTNESTWGLRVDGYADDPSTEVGTVAAIGDLLPMYVARGTKGDQIGMFSTLEDGFKAVIKRSHGKA